MTPAFQLNLAHRPEEGKWGDCLRACIASLFDMKPEQVPHFAHDATAEEGTERLRIWLAARGIVPMLVQISAEDYERTCGELRDSGVDAFHLLAGVGIGGLRHIVVAKHGRCVHDPTPFGIPGRGELLPDPARDAYDFMFFVVSFESEHTQDGFQP